MVFRTIVLGLKALADFFKIKYAFSRALNVSRRMRKNMLVFIVNQNDRNLIHRDVLNSDKNCHPFTNN